VAEKTEDKIKNCLIDLNKLIKLMVKKHIKLLRWFDLIYDTTPTSFEDVSSFVVGFLDQNWPVIETSNILNSENQNINMFRRYFMVSRIHDLGTQILNSKHQLDEYKRSSQNLDVSIDGDGMSLVVDTSVKVIDFASNVIDLLSGFR